MKKQLLTVLVLLCSLQAFAKGGESGGGGNLTPLTSANPKQIRLVLKNIQSYLTMVFNAKHWDNGVPKDQAQQVKRNIRMVLSKFRPAILEDQPCLDLLSNRKMASIHNTPKGTVCFSLSEMVSQPNLLNETNYFSRTLGMAAHEYAHLAGIKSEEVAEMIENNVSTSTSKASLEGTSESLKLLAPIIFHVYLSAKSAKEADNDAAKCYQLAAAQNYIEQLYRFDMGLLDSGLDPYTEKTSVYRFLLATKVGNFFFYCDGRDVKSQEEKAIGDYFNDPLLKNYRLRDLSKRNIGDLNKEIDDVTELGNLVSSSYPQLK